MALLEAIGGRAPADGFHRGAGCNFCAHTGFLERIGVYEMMPVTHGIREMILHRASHDEIRKTARHEGMRTLQEEAGRLVEAGVRGGERLSDCFDRHPKIFPEFYRGILRSAELTGQLDTVLDQLARYLERDLEARRKVKAASIYPSMIAVAALVTVVVLAG